MKSLNHLLKGGLIFSATLLIFSCAKQIEEPQEEIVATAVPASTGCKPTVFGALIKFPNDFTVWQTFMQKWYDGTGKLTHIKASISHFHEIFPGPGNLELPWGVVTYHGNQVYVHDNGKLVLRVTLNGDGKPEASYLYTNNPPNSGNEIDTSYYTYSGGRLTEMQTLRWTGSSFLSLRYQFIYDAHGNIMRIQTGTSQNSAMAHFQYNYSKPSNGMLAYYVLTLSLKLMEYMDLVNLPMHHELTQYWFGAYLPGSSYPYETFPVYVWNYQDHMYNANNLVQSYQVNSATTRSTLYTGWECEGSTNVDPANRARTGPIQSLDDFNQRYPN